MDALQNLGALTKSKAMGRSLEPLAERAKGHKECRTREEALEFLVLQAIFSFDLAEMLAKKMSNSKICLGSKLLTV